MTHAKYNPHSINPESFIFWNIDFADKPHGSRSISTALNRALTSIGIDESERRARGLCFHSHRHYFSKKMASVIDQRTMKLTGHKTAAVFEHYANHADELDFRKAARATSEVFGNILLFDKVKVV